MNKEEIHHVTQSLHVYRIYYKKSFTVSATTNFKLIIILM